MDIAWFKQKQKLAGVTAGDIAARMGRSRSNVSHIFNGSQRMSIAWAQAFSDVLNVPLDEVLARAGVLGGGEAESLRPGVRVGDVVPFQSRERDNDQNEGVSRVLGGDAPGMGVWTVQSQALSLDGIMVGDQLLVDTRLSELARAGDAVLAKRYDKDSGSNITLLRRYEPPVLVAASCDPSSRRVYYVDGDNVAIVGKVVASWRRMS